jgi:hypothetical protein
VFILTCLFVSDFDGVCLQRDKWRPTPLIECRNLNEELDSGFEVADAQMRIPSGFVVKENGRLRIEDFELKQLRVTTVESRPAPDFHRLSRLIQHRTIARWIRTHCNTTERNVLFPYLDIISGWNYLGCTSEENAIDARLPLLADHVARPADEAAVITIRLRRVGNDARPVRLCCAFLSFVKFV